MELEDIGETDAFGMSVIDGVFRGGQCFCQYRSKEYKPGSLGAFWPWGAGLGVLVTAAVPIGVLASDIAKAMVLTSTAGTPAASAPATITAAKALLAKNSNLSLMLNSKLREVPTRLRFYPYASGSSLIFYVLT